MTYEVVIAAPNESLKLKPGLTASVSIFTLEKNGVLAVPSKALRFTPNEAILTPDQKIEDCEGTTKVWTFDGTTFRAHPVQIGTTNGTLTEIISGIEAGTELVTEFNIEEEIEEEQQTSNPFMPGRRNNNRNQQQQGGQNSNRQGGQNAGGR